jgi:hypothetical protein
MEKGRVLIGLSCSLLGYIFLLSGIPQLLIIILVSMLALLAIGILLTNKFPNRIKLRLSEISNSLNVGWLTLSLALFGTGIRFIQNSNFSEMLFWVGAVFIILSAVFIGRSIGEGSRMILEANAKFLLLLGVAFVILGAFSFIYSWSSIIEDYLKNITVPMFLLVYGIINIYFAWRRWRNLKIIDAIVKR